MALALGIDQGGTKTDVVIVDELGHILAFENDRDHMIPACERRELRMKRIRFAADKAFSAANCSSSDISGVYACCIGADWKFEYEVNRTNVARTLNIQNVAMYNDCMGALRGGINPAGKDCAVVCLGTGIMVNLRNEP